MFDSDQSTPVVRVALGWRARDVEQQSSAPVHFPDRDLGTVILEDQPAVLAYADPAHAFMLPPGRFLRLDEAAGRVYEAAATPHVAALVPQEAVVLADSIVRSLERAGWTRASGIGRGAIGAVTAAVERPGDAQVGTWRVARGGATWAALPTGTPPSAEFWNGTEAVVTVRRLRGSGADARLVLQVQLTDVPLNNALFVIMEARRSRLGGEMQTLQHWDAHPTEPMPASPPG